MKLLIRGVRIVDAFRESKGDILVEGGRIARVGRLRGVRADRTIDGGGMAAIPGLVNTHTHAAMVLFRGHTDDLELREWLQRSIWPLEKNLREEHVHHGSRLAALEMLRTGTTAFNDMYYFPEATARAAQEAGIRAVVSAVFFNAFEKRPLGEHRRRIEGEIARCRRFRGVRPAVGPHAAYTVDTGSRRAPASRRPSTSPSTSTSPRPAGRSRTTGVSTDGASWRPSTRSGSSGPGWWRPTRSGSTPGRSGGWGGGGSTSATAPRAT